MSRREEGGYLFAIEINVFPSSSQMGSILSFTNITNCIRALPCSHHRVITKYCNLMYEYSIVHFFFAVKYIPVWSRTPKPVS